MRSYYLKYLLLFLTSVILIDLSLFFFTDHKKDVDMSSLLILGQAIQSPMDKADINKVNSVIDIFPEKIIIERDGSIFTSNFGKEQDDRASLAKEQLQSYKMFWQPILISGANKSETLYYKSREINYFNKLLMDFIFSLLLGLCLLPMLIFTFRDINSLFYSIEHLRQYLLSSREQLEDIKSRQVEGDFDINNEKERLHKKLVESKNKRIALQKELEKSKIEADKKNEEASSLRESVANLKLDLQNNKVDKNRLEEAKTIATKEKQDVVKKMSQLEQEIKSRDLELEKNFSKIQESDNLVLELKKSLQQKEADLQNLRNSKVDNREYEELKQNYEEIRKDMLSKNNDIRDLLVQIENKQFNIEKMKESNHQINVEKLRLQNELGSLKVRTGNDRDIIDSLVQENNSYKDKVVSLEDKLKDEIVDPETHKVPTYLDADHKRLSILLKDRENQVHQLMEDNQQKERELKEFTLDTLDKLSSLKRYETQIVDMTREVLQKNNTIDSLTSRSDVKDKLIKTLNKELNDLRDKINSSTSNQPITSNNV